MIDDVTAYTTLIKLYEKQLENSKNGILAGMISLIAVSLGWFLVAGAVKNSIMLFMISVDFLALIFFCMAFLFFYLGRFFLLRKQILLLNRMVRVNARG